MMERTGTLINIKYREYFISTLAMTGSTVVASIVDMIMISNLIDPGAMAAITLTSPIIFIINVVFGLYIYGGNTLAATYRGGRDSENANKCFTIAILGGTLACLFLMVIGLLAFKPLTGLLCVGNEELYITVSEYLLPLLFMGPLVILVNGTAAFVRSDGISWLALEIPIVTNMINLALDYVFMALLKLGVRGAALATDAGFAGALVLVVLYFRSDKRTVFFQKKALSDIRLTAEIFKTGLATALLNASLLLKNYIVNAIVISLYGAIGVVIMSVCLSGNNIANVLYMGTSQTLLPIGGALYGEKDYTGIRYLLKTASIVTVAICTALAVLLSVFSHGFAGLFDLDIGSIGELYDMAFRMFCVSMPFVGLQNIARSHLQACGHKNAATVLMLLDGTVCFIPFIYLLSIAAPKWIWISFTIAPVLSMAAVYGYMRIRLKKEGITDPLLLPKEDEATAKLELSFESAPEAVEESSEKVLSFCRYNGLSDSAGNKLWLSVQELCSNISQYAYPGKIGNIDIFLKISAAEVILRIRDNGIIFNPSKFMDDSGEVITGLKLLRAMKIELNYNRVLGFNNTIITVNQEKDG